MKKIIYSCLALVIAQSVFALDTVFDSMDQAKEVKLAPQITVKPTSSTTPIANPTIKEQKFNSALVNLDDAQVELREELAVTTSKYNEALAEKERVIANCKALKVRIKEINKKMKNVDKSKKMINANLEERK